MNSIQLFDFNEVPVRVMLIAEQPWWVAVDVCRIIQLGNPSKAVADLQEDEKRQGVVNSAGGPQSYNLISESGLYSLIFRSRKPEAQTFRKWVTSEVLPAIRRTGRYAPPAQPTPVARPAARAPRAPKDESHWNNVMEYVLNARLDFHFHNALIIRMGDQCRRVARSLGVPIRRASHPDFGQVRIFPSPILEMCLAEIIAQERRKRLFPSLMMLK